MGSFNSSVLYLAITNILLSNHHRDHPAPTCLMRIVMDRALITSAVSISQIYLMLNIPSCLF